MDEQSQYRSIKDHRSGVTVRVPVDPPPVTARVARALLEILIELSDRERPKRAKEQDSQEDGKT